MAQVLTWDDVLKQTGSAAKKKGLEKFNGRVVEFSDFQVGSKGKKNVRRILTAQAFSQGMPVARVTIPERYATRLHELIEAQADQIVDGQEPEPIIIRAMVEAGEHGAMLKPVEEKPAPDPTKPRRGRRPRTQHAQDVAAD